MNAVVSSLRKENEALKAHILSLEQDLKSEKSRSMREIEMLVAKHNRKTDSMMNERKNFSNCNNQPKRNARDDYLKVDLNRLDERLCQLQKYVLPTISGALRQRILSHQQYVLNSGLIRAPSRHGKCAPLDAEFSCCSSQAHGEELSVREVHLMDARLMTEKLDQSLSVLEIVLKAKMESMQLVHQKLKEQIQDVQLKNSMMLSEFQRKFTESEIKESSHEKDKQRVKDQIAQLQLLYNSHMEKHRREVHVMSLEKDGLMERISLLEERILEREKACENLKNEIATLTNKMNEQSVVRIQFASQITQLHQQNEIQKQEIELLKLSQKFLRVSPFDGEPSVRKHSNQAVPTPDPLVRIPQEKFNLMKMVNELMDLNSQLQHENIDLSGEVRRLKALLPSNSPLELHYRMEEDTTEKPANNNTHHIPSTIDKEVTLVANDRISLDSLANKLLLSELNRSKR